jgi:hypothetical protein
METNEKYWNILQQINDWVKYSETKASIILTVHGIIITVVYSNSKSVFEALNQSNFLFYSTLLYIALSILSIFFSFRCVNPRLKNPNPTSIIYFGHIAKKFPNFKNYYNHSKPIIVDENAFSEQISEQIFINSGIAWKKFVNVSWSLRIFIIGIVVLMVSVLIYLILNIK